MAAVFALVGVQLDLSQLEEGVSSRSGTRQGGWGSSSRRPSIRKGAGLTAGGAAALLGRLQLAESQLFGGRGAVMLGPTRDIASHTVAGGPLAAEAAEAMLWVEGHLRGARPPGRFAAASWNDRRSSSRTVPSSRTARGSHGRGLAAACWTRWRPAQHAYYGADLSKHLGKSKL